MDDVNDKKNKYYGILVNNIISTYVGLFIIAVAYFITRSKTAIIIGILLLCLIKVIQIYFVINFKHSNYSFVKDVILVQFIFNLYYEFNLLFCLVILVVNMFINFLYTISSILYISYFIFFGIYYFFVNKTKKEFIFEIMKCTTVILVLLLILFISLKIDNILKWNWSKILLLVYPIAFILVSISLIIVIIILYQVYNNLFKDKSYSGSFVIRYIFI